MTIGELYINNSENFQGGNSTALNPAWSHCKWGSCVTAQVAKEGSLIIRHLNSPEKTKP